MSEIPTPPVDTEKMAPHIRAALEKKVEKATLDAEQTFQLDVTKNVYGRWVTHEAKKRFEGEVAEQEFDAPPHEFWTLEEQLAAPEVPQEYLIDGLMIADGNLLLAAAKKSGKTTLMLNLMKSLCDGTPFLGKFAVSPRQGRVAWWDYELDRNYATNQLRALGIQNPARAATEHLRGYSTPLIAPAVQDWAVDWLQKRQVEVWIIDPFGAVFTGEENSNDDVREWHKAVDLIKRRAGVREVILVTHTGHGDVEEGHERTRGASRLGDWADNSWAWSGSSLSNESEGLPVTQRWLTLPQSRGVEPQRYTVDCDTASWTLSVVGEGGRKTATENRLKQSIIEFLRTVTEPQTTGAVKENVKGKAEAITTALGLLVRDGTVVKEAGPRNANLYRLTSVIPPIPNNSQPFPS